VARHAPGPDLIIENGISGLLCSTVPELAAALDKITAHGANNGGVSAELLPDGLYQGEVTIMQGIIFCYDTSGFHICHLKAVTK